MKTLAQTPCANAQPTTPVVAPQGPADPTTSRPYETAGRFKPLGPTPDAEDLDLHVDRCAPGLLTARCRELVPGLGFVEGVVVEAGPDGVIASLPLLPGPMNQNAIHLASNHYLLADWVLAMGLFTSLPGTTVVGIHEPRRSTPIQIWTLAANIEHLAAGTGRLDCRCTLSEEDVTAVRDALVRKGKAVFERTLTVYQGRREVSRVTMRQMVLAIHPMEVGGGITMIQAHQLKVSSLLVAGLKEDPLSQQVAGEQGRALAERMDTVTPPLRSLIHARTRHQDQALTRTRYAQVLVLGIGLDTRPLRLDVGPDCQWFGVDLSAGIQNRKRRFAHLDQPDPTVLIEADLRRSGWFSRLEVAGLDRDKPTFVTLEGLSMYLGLAELRAVLTRLGEALSHSQTRVWIDHVTPDLLESPLEVVQDFLSTMSRMNEPFLTGIDDADTLSERWHLSSLASARDLTGTEDGIHEHYRFGLLRRSHPPHA